MLSSNRTKDQYTEYNFIMQGRSHSPLKTVNITHNIFYEDLPDPKDKTIPGSHRRLNHRNNYFQNPYNRTVVVQRYEDRLRNDVEMPELSGQERRQSKIVKGRAKTRQGKNQYLVQMFKTGKTNTENAEKRRYKSIDPSKLKDTIFFNPSHSIISPTQISKNRKQRLSSRIKKQSKSNQPKQQSSKTINLVDIQGDIKVNPYTRQKYKYLMHQQEDQLAELRKNSRVKQISAFTHSYKVTHIQMSPPKQRTKVEVTRPSPMPVFKETVVEVDKVYTPMLASKIYDGGAEPTPWEWGNQSSTLHPNYIE